MICEMQLLLQIISAMQNVLYNYLYQCVSNLL